MAKPAADKILREKFVRVVSHHDADGITACGIICLALQRQRIPFQATIVSNLDASVAAVLDPAVPVIFCDMGSGQPDIVNRFDAVVLDHHIPSGTAAGVHVNPHLAGIDGGTEMSASGVAYAVARAMGDNVDLAGLAVSGAIGDKQRMVGPNRAVLDEGVANGVIGVRKGLKLGMGPVAKVLQYSTDPYFDFSGKREATEQFVRELGLTGDIEALSHDDLKRLGSALSLLLLKRSPPETIDSLFGDVYLLNRELIRDVYDFTNTVNSCGKMGLPGLGLSVCLRYAPAMADAQEKRFEYSGQILEALHKAISEVRELSDLRYLDICCSDVTGAIASTIIRYVMPDKPIVVLNVEGDRIKVSARGTTALIRRGLDLAAAVREGARAAGGSGGGHKIASGAAIPAGREQEFLEAVNAIVRRQLNGKV